MPVEKNTFNNTETVDESDINLKYFERKVFAGKGKFWHITVFVNEIWYCVPSYCLVDLLWPLPETYKEDKYEWVDAPLQNTSLEMMREAIAANPEKFKAFIFE